MSLSFTNTTSIGSTTFTYKELKIKHLKIIQKCLFGNEPDLNTLFINFNNILASLTNISKKDIFNLDFFIYILLLLEIRCTCMGNIIFAQLTDKPNVKLEINIYRIINTLKTFYENTFIEPDFLENIKVYYKYPSFKDIISLTDDNFYDIFIKQIDTKEHSIIFENYKKHEKVAIINNLPSKVLAIISKKIQSFLSSLNQINLAKTIPGLEDKELYFNISSVNILFLLKITFGDQLFDLYETIFYLCKQGNFNANYIENLTPGEYILYTKKLQELNSKNASQSVSI